jgi:hypothetical protein
MLAITLPNGFLFSQTSLQDYCDCPLRFQLRYLEKMEWPAVEMEPALENERRQMEGQFFHRLVQQHILGIPSESLNRLTTTPDLQRWWKNYLSHPIQTEGYTLYPELTLTAPVGEHYRMLAKYDLLAIQPGTKAFIYDWKTSAKRPSNERMAARWQTRVYRALLVQAGGYLNNGSPISPGQVSLIYWYADYPAEPASFMYSENQYKQDITALTALVGEIASRQEFTKTEDERICAYCTYRSYCERGAAAGHADEFEADLMEPELDLEQIQEIAF